MKLNSTIRIAKTYITILFVFAGLTQTLHSTAQISSVCTDPNNIIYGMTGNGEIREININTAATGAVIKDNTYPGNSASSANGLGYNYVNGKFYYFKRNVSKTSQEFVSFDPSTNTVSILATSTCTDDVHTGCVNATGTGYYTVDIDGNLHYYDIAKNQWTLITSRIVDQNGTDVDSVIRNQSSGDMAIDGWGNIWLVTSSNPNYGLYTFPGSLPTTPVVSLTVINVVAPTASTPAGRSFAGIAFSPSGQIYMATKSGDRLYRLNNDFSLTSIGAMTTSDIGNDLTSCSFPYLVLPVSWNSFTISLQNKNLVNLDWEVLEENNNGFYVEHSLDGTNWNDISFVPSKGGHGTTQTYAYTHINNHNGTQYYRIRQQNDDGKQSYSPVKTIELKNDKQAISLWPNPASNIVSIANEAGNSNPFTKAQVFDLSGRLLITKQLQPTGINNLDIHSLPKSVYVVRIETSNGTVYNQKISKQ